MFKRYQTKVLPKEKHFLFLVQNITSSLFTTTKTNDAAFTVAPKFILLYSR